jgi:hypothetical protein
MIMNRKENKMSGKGKKILHGHSQNLIRALLFKSKMTSMIGR